MIKQLLAAQRHSIVLIGFLAITLPALAADPLPSWKEGANREAILGFVEKVTKEGTADYVPAPERVAVFDNDGTLWSEQPLYFQVVYMLDRIKAMAPDHPEWKTTEPYKSALSGDLNHLVSQGMGGLMELLTVTHTGMTAEDFSSSVADWLDTARHPTTGLPYTAMIFQPMLELIDYLHDNEFKVFIVSGGGIDFIRVFSESVYDIPPERVVGTTLEAEFELRDGIPTIVRKPEISLVDDKVGKPVGIYRHIGRRPIIAGGNSDGDLQMLQYTTIPRDSNDTRPRLGLIVHHTDKEREFAYGRESHIGKLDKAMDEAPDRGWLLIDMKDDWSTMYPTKP